MIHIENNQCPICLQSGFLWDLNHCKSQVEMFKCGHGTCKDCYQQMYRTNQMVGTCFSCPLCRGDEQQYNSQIMTTQTGAWVTFAEWYSDYEIYIRSGLAKNVVHNSVFGQQLLRLIRENKKATNQKAKNQKATNQKATNQKAKNQKATNQKATNQKAKVSYH